MGWAAAAADYMIVDLIRGRGSGTPVTVPASHMVDARWRPLGWREFLRAVADINIWLATEPNRHVKD